MDSQYLEYWASPYLEGAFKPATSETMAPVKHFCVVRYTLWYEQFGTFLGRWQDNGAQFPKTYPIVEAKISNGQIAVQPEF